MSKHNTGGKIKSGREVLDSLKEGHGVVMIEMGGGLLSPYGDSQNIMIEQGEKDLRQLLAGAKTMHKGKAFLYIKKNGVLKCESSNALFANTGKSSKSSFDQVPGYHGMRC
ncbi:MAG: hypothetical protein WC349_03720 [Patescibacteria group bacterium]|jgi:hypothetical protein